MNKLKLLVTNKTNSNSTHCKLFIDNEDCGVLFLSERELDTLYGILRSGCLEREASFELEDPFISEEDS